MRVELVGLDRDARLLGGDLGVDDDRVRYAAQAHADEVEERDLGAGEAGAHPDGQEGQEEEDQQQQGAGADPEDDGGGLVFHGKGLSGPAGR